jgi:hypothetical protein
MALATIFFLYVMTTKVAAQLYTTTKIFNMFISVVSMQIVNQKEVVVDSNYLGMAVSSNPILLRYRQVTTC